MTGNRESRPPLPRPPHLPVVGEPARRDDGTTLLQPLFQAQASGAQRADIHRESWRNRPKNGWIAGILKELASGLQHERGRARANYAAIRHAAKPARARMQQRRRACPAKRGQTAAAKQV
ncbi:hypothetical protein BGL_1c29240 [Burkholderia plantarii]|uniref:Uncharacterized protein n=1 Tax=Burkholderia plantarii TaxID=41899 RepID=A0A0B6S594_BURPL|nr:hypothetical protein BGL_1c29240 [Burkholderia plantarii]